MEVCIVVAMEENRAIGKDNDLLWHLPADLRHFKEKTMGHPMIMGRRTFESIGKALPGRTSIVVTSDSSWSAAGVLTVSSIEQALRAAESDARVRGVEKVMIIGGAQIYEQMIEKAQRLFVTEVHTSMEADAFFPEIDLDQWQEVSRQDFNADALNSLAYSFVEYQQKTVCKN